MDTYRTLTPYLVVSDAEGEIQFLQAAFGATEKNVQRDNDGRVMHAELEVGDSLVMLGQANEQWKPNQASLYVWVPNVDAVYEKAIAAGAKSQFAPEDKPYGHRSGGVVDANSVTWWIASPL